MTTEALKEVLAEHALTLLYFSTPSCNVCKVLRPKVEALLKEEPPWHFQYVNTEESLEIAGQNLVFTVPTILLMAEGREIARFSRHFGMGELEGPVRRYAKMFGDA
ncbi:MAG: thioredoxin family protein [Candidatus Marinimicrobia bacterium]|nr:thioredoxin family protein [Candidatus Neomarinimicrobiota bacterium]